MSLGFARKIGMTRLFVDGKSVPVTVLQFSKSYVVQTKTTDKDGYYAVQVGSQPKRKSTKPLSGHIKKYTELDTEFQFLSEFKDINVDADKKFFTAEDFSESDLLDITGISTGRGFAGVVKRHGFAGQPASHGHDHERAPGSIGSRWPQRVVKGRRMAGHMGASQVTLKKVKLVAIDTQNQLLFVNGSVPGSNSSFLKLQKKLA